MAIEGRNLLEYVARTKPNTWRSAVDIVPEIIGIRDTKVPNIFFAIFVAMSN